MSGHRPLTSLSAQSTLQAINPASSSSCPAFDPCHDVGFAYPHDELNLSELPEWLIQSLMKVYYAPDGRKITQNPVLCYRHYEPPTAE